jgi:uncharacterized Zn finger protein (UPF0148 family)
LKNGDLWCGKCEKKVMVLKQGEEASQVTSSMVLESVEATLLARVQEIQKKMQNTKDMEELQKLGVALSTLLDNIEKIRKAKKA